MRKSRIAAGATVAAAVAGGVATALTGNGLFLLSGLAAACVGTEGSLYLEGREEHGWALNKLREKYPGLSDEELKKKFHRYDPHRDPWIWAWSKSYGHAAAGWRDPKKSFPYYQ